MEFENIIKLIKTVSDSNLTQFFYEENGLKIEMATDKEQLAVTWDSAIPKMPAQANGSGNGIQNNVNLDNAIPNAAKEPIISETGNVIKSPLVGTFYAAAAPSEEPFVKPGDTVKKGQVLGIIEAMKLMNEIESDFDGVVREILVSNEEVIEYGQPMFVIE